MLLEKEGRAHREAMVAGPLLPMLGAPFQKCIIHALNVQLIPHV